MHLPADDLFTLHPGWLQEFADRYPAAVGVPFTCNSSVELISKNSASALARAGCRGVAIGIETGNEVLRSKILNKTVTNDHIRQAAALIKGGGMELTTFNMLGSPGETLQDALDTLALNREIGADHVRVSMALPVPGTAFETDAFASGHLASDAGRVDTLTDPDSPFREQEQAIANLFYLFRFSVHRPALDRLMRPLLRLPAAWPLRPMRMSTPLMEKRINNISWVDGLRFYRHVGDPRKKTSNYVTLI